MSIVDEVNRRDEQRQAANEGLFAVSCLALLVSLVAWGAA